MNPVLLTFLSCYAIAKKLFEISVVQNFSDRNRVFKVVLKIGAIMLASLMIIGIVTLLLPFMTLKFLFYLYLRGKHGLNFAGFLNGLRTSFALAEERVELKSILFVEYDDRPDNFYEDLKAVVVKTHNDFYHLGCTVEKFFGYYYFVKNQVQANDILSRVTLNDDKNTLTLDEVLDYVDNHYVVDDKRLWEVVLITQPVWLGNAKHYPFFFRVNHSVADGISFISMITKHVLLNFDEHKRDISKIDLGKYKNSLTLDNCYAYKSPFAYHDDGLKEGHRQYTAFYAEDEPDKVLKIKAVAKKLNVSYSDVLIAGVVQGISSLLDKKNAPSNGKLQLAITGSVDMKQVENLLQHKFEVSELKNCFFSVPVIVPLREEGTSRSSLLLDISKACALVKKSMNALIIYNIIKYVSPIFPAKLYAKSFLWCSKKVSFIFTNMVAFGRSGICGREMGGFLAAVTLPANKCIFVATGSYADRLQLNVTGRFNFLENRSDIKYVLEEALDYVEGLFNELIRDGQQNEKSTTNLK